MTKPLLTETNEKDNSFPLLNNQKVFGKVKSRPRVNRRLITSANQVDIRSARTPNQYHGKEYATFSNLEDARP